jgi:hypothetical protein
MKQIDLGQAVGILANIGVIAGIVFLAIEVAQNTESLEETRNLAIAQAQQDRASDLDESFRSLANSDFLPAIFLKYQQQGISALTDEEQLRFLWQSCSGISRLDTLHAWYERGYVEEDEYDVVFRQVVLGFSERWRDLAIAPIRPAFRREVERIYEQAGLSVTFPENSRC